jgi:hypothetical protein
MSNINTLASAIENATLNAPREKGLIAAKAWTAALTPVLSAFPNAIENLNSWVACGSSNSTSSGIAYKSKHNRGIFPSEQIFCNTRAKARRNLSTVCKAVATALVDNVAYNPDRFRSSLTMEGMEQGLTQFNVALERIEKAAISQAIVGLKLNKSEKALIVDSNKALVESKERREHTAKALEVSATIEAIIAKYSKPAKLAKPAKPEAAKPEASNGRKPRAA